MKGVESPAEFAFLRWTKVCFTWNEPFSGASQFTVAWTLGVVSATATQFSAVPNFGCNH